MGENISRSEMNYIIKNVLHLCQNPDTLPKKIENLISSKYYHPSAWGDFSYHTSIGSLPLLLSILDDALIIKIPDSWWFNITKQYIATVGLNTNLLMGALSHKNEEVQSLFNNIIILSQFEV